MVVQQQKQGRPENIWKNPARAEETMRGSEAGRLRGTLSIEISKGVERTHSYKIPRDSRHRFYCPKVEEQAKPIGRKGFYR